MTQTETNSARAEIAFDAFPAESSATALGNTLRSLAGVVGVDFDVGVRRVSVCFKPSIVNISILLTKLQPFGQNPRVVAVISPCFHGFPCQ